MAHGGTWLLHLLKDSEEPQMTTIVRISLVNVWNKGNFMINSANIYEIYCFNYSLLSHPDLIDEKAAYRFLYFYSYFHKHLFVIQKYK